VTSGETLDLMHHPLIWEKLLCDKASLFIFTFLFLFLISLINKNAVREIKILSVVENHLKLSV
jgi:hypothetical protein